MAVPTTVQLVELALSILPKFVDAARQRSSKSTEGSPRYNFYQTSQATYVDLSETLGALSERRIEATVVSSESIEFNAVIAQLLQSLEDIAGIDPIQEASQLQYPKLRNLRFAEANDSNDFCGLRQFKHKAKKNDRRQHKEALDRSLRRLKALLERNVCSNTDSTERVDAVPGRSNQSNTLHPATARNNVPTIFHKAMAACWQCEHWPPHQAQLRLATCRPLDEAGSLKFDLLFSTEPERNWKKAQITLARDKIEEKSSSVTFSDHVTQMPIRVISKTIPASEKGIDKKPSMSSGRSQTGDHSSQPTITGASSADGSLDANVRSDHFVEILEASMGGICQLVSSLDAQRQLVLLVAKETKTGPSLSGKLETFPCDQILNVLSLKDSLGAAKTAKGVSLRQQDQKEKLLLAVVLSHAMMQLYGSPWTHREWTNSRLGFGLCNKQRNTLANMLELYLSSMLDERASSENVHAQHKHPRLLDLGILLLEIELGGPLERHQLPTHLGSNGETLANTKILIAERLLQSDKLCQTFPDYRDAIMACLNAKDCLGKDHEYVQRKIQQDIVEPLETLLANAYKIKIDGNAVYVGDKILAADESPGTFPLQEPAGSVADLQVEQTVSPSVSVGQFLDCEAELVSDNPSSWHYADKWFEQLEAHVQPLLEALREAASSQPTPRTLPRVKIAILDTGIDACTARSKIIVSHPSLKARGNSCIKAYRRWTDSDPIEGSVPTQMTDPHGHGTHATASLTRVAPFADIYVAQIVKGDAIFEPDADAVADAIDFATKKWDVDIITMSFGFPKPAKNSPSDMKRIIAAIERANAKHIIMFAAASNGGRITGQMFPSTLDEVIAVRSADVHGNPSKFNPQISKLGPYSYHFNVIGEYVSSAWPFRLDPKGSRRQSGSSVATPIAAGVAAIVLEYVKCKLCESPDIHEQEILWSRFRRQSHGLGVRKALALLSEQGDCKGPDFIRPWGVLSHHDPDKAWRMFQEILV
ncbi:hypothetical protein AYO20_01676 [Fonsecaea nubica]|uniref:Uncharacterized protein n=1 Tax=Fonsecaea nubica TaxID=856822 RepID=A0A178DCU2_9EURO|nr:hypothetical protein AYO20_01676 [Fonsecaea nubica]OAL38925.1 hypothetical protein AYO20_01676 [Fonsecaea nubica]